MNSARIWKPRNNTYMLVPEGLEEPQPTHFISQDLLGVEENPVLDHAHAPLWEIQGRQPTVAFYCKSTLCLPPVWNSLLQQTGQISPLLYVYCSMFLFIFPQRLCLVFSTQQYWESPHQSECHTVLMTLLQPLSLQNNIPKRLTFRNRLIFLFCLCFLSCVPAKDKPMQISFVLDPYGSVSTLSTTKRESTLVCKLEL